MFEARDLVGTWALVSWDLLFEDGGASQQWMGRHPTGTIIYGADGNMSVQAMRDPRPHFSPGAYPPPIGTASLEEIADAYGGYYAYFGTYEVDAESGAVVHHVRGSLWPFEVGVDYTRFADFNPDGLVLTSPVMQVNGRHVRSRLTWRRSGA